jgi:dolichyl-phosphate-mannose--protein O-mannosyl transferase
MDHTIPIIALILEYFLANPVFIKRHLYALLIIILVYLPIYMYFIFSGNPPYP